MAESWASRLTHGVAGTRLAEGIVPSAADNSGIVKLGQQLSASVGAQVLSPFVAKAQAATRQSNALKHGAASSDHLSGIASLKHPDIATVTSIAPAGDFARSAGAAIAEMTALTQPKMTAISSFLPQTSFARSAGDAIAEMTAFTQPKISALASIAPQTSFVGTVGPLWSEPSIRVDFSDDAAWNRLVGEVETQSGNTRFDDDDRREYERKNPEQILAFSMAASKFRKYVSVSTQKSSTALIPQCCRILRRRHITCYSQIAWRRSRQPDGGNFSPRGAWRNDGVLRT